MTSYHRRLLIACSGGPFLDGYLLTIIALALPGVTKDLHLSPTEMGLTGAASLVGLFVGSLWFGAITDRVGRRAMYTIDLVAMVVFSALCIVVTDAWQLIALRFLIGIAVGADYPIATSLLAEWIPRQKRGPWLGLLSAYWQVGAVVSCVVGFAVTVIGTAEGWRWMLGSSVVAALAVLLIRIGILESPRWLLHRDRREEARAAVEKALQRTVRDEELDELASHSSSGGRAGRRRYRDLFHGIYLRRTLYCGLSWLCQVTPQMAIFTFAPTVLQSFGLHEGAQSILGSLVLNAVYFAGQVPASFLLERLGRRKVVISMFTMSTLALLPVAFWPGMAVEGIVSAFILYALFNAATSVFVFIYPNELFPTEIRASAVGIATAISRVGAALGTFLIPVALVAIGNGPTMLVAAVLTAIGLVLSIVWAEETRGRTLEETSTGAPALPTKGQLTS
ncbi:MFS transporter [Pseudonocardia acaciae]|uniref:MFS transporter n=1 Tax=Pseudonocardia acaciae TaxID=551276 RepID=UPI00146FF9FC|nr:MFS transporter [Pseudonocardia acaciae]